MKRNKRGANIPIPSWYYEKKEVPEHLGWFWQAYWELDTCRSYTEGIPSHIPWLAAKEYAQFHKIDFKYLWHLVVVIDNDFIGFRTQQRQKEIDELKSKSKVKTSSKGSRHGR